MNIEEAKELFKDNYVNQRISLKHEYDKELYFQDRNGVIIKVSESDLENFCEFENRRNNYECIPNECSMCGLNYREQAIERSDKYRPMSMMLRNGDIEFKSNIEGEMYCTIGYASNDFINFFRFKEGYLNTCIDRIRFRTLGGRQEEMELFNMLHIPFTIKAYNINAPNTEEAINVTKGVIDGCLFTLSYLKNITLMLLEEWPSPINRRLKRKLTHRDSRRGRELPFPKGKPNADLVRYYQRAMSTEDPVNSFLSFYQILEYFFLSVSEEKLYHKLSQRLKDPNFQIKAKDLDKIIQDTLNHKSESDETSMLKYVLEKYVDEHELIEFIRKYEHDLDESIFTKKKEIFGQSFEIKLQSGHVISNAAKRIKNLRNVLVHSSDKYQRNDVFVPTKANEEIVKKELPLIKNIAESVIIGSMY